MVKRPISWFVTEKGRKFSNAVLTSCGIAISVAIYVPQTILLFKYKEYVHYYRNALPVELPQSLQEECKKCVDILNLPDGHKKLIRPFSVNGFDLFHAGSVNSKYGVALGIPVNFTYKSFADLVKDDIQVNQKKVDWQSEAGKKLADALLLPDAVKRFAICREILMTQNNKIIFDSLYPFFGIFFAYNLSSYINAKLKLYGAPTVVRFALYTIVGMFGMGMYFLMKDMTQVQYESKVDKRLCELGPEFIESGIIFYDKILQRNQALRELMGKEGEKKYSILGNENFGLRYPRLAIMHRKNFFEHKLEELNEKHKENESSSESVHLDSGNRVPLVN